MFETNIQNNPALISLARAAEITGYHQDYLGQLCRLGRLPAKKVGRNWFTTNEALSSFSNPLNQVIETNILEEDVLDPESEVLAAPQIPTTAPAPVAMDAISAPGVTRTTVISQVEGLPITIQSVPTQSQGGNSVQAIASNMRIQALQREVLELREMLTRLMTEVAKHAELLGGRSPIDLLRSQQQDSLRHSYISNFDFSPPRAQAEQLSELTQDSVQIETQTIAPQIWFAPPSRRYATVTWAAAAASLAALAYLGTSIVTGTLWGQEPVGRTVYYSQNEPEVAGVESSTEPAAPPTEPVTSESLINVLQ